MKSSGGHQYGELIVEPGFEAPDFTLKDEAGREVTFSTFREGRFTVLVFIKGADDRHLYELMDFLKDSYERIKFHNADVLVISTGDAVFNKALIMSRSLPFHILSDARLEAVKAYDIYHKPEVLTGPVMYIVSPGGLINFFYEGKNPDDIVEMADIIRMLHQLNEEDGSLVFGGSQDHTQ